MKPNPGYCPDEAKGKRVKGRLANGDIFGDKPTVKDGPLGWAADGKSGCRWTKTGSAFDIAEYEVV